MNVVGKRTYNIDGIYDFQLENVMNKIMPFAISNSSLKDIIRNVRTRLGVMAHAYNPSTLGG